MENCNTMAPDVAKRLGVIGKNEIEEAVARTEPYLKKRKIYRAVSFDSVFGLDEFLHKKSREGHNFTVVKVMVTPNSRYSLVYYEEE